MKNFIEKFWAWMEIIDVFMMLIGWFVFIISIIIMGIAYIVTGDADNTIKLIAENVANFILNYLFTIWVLIWVINGIHAAKEIEKQNRR